MLVRKSCAGKLGSCDSPILKRKRYSSSAAGVGQPFTVTNRKHTVMYIILS